MLLFIALFAAACSAPAATQSATVPIRLSASSPAGNFYSAGEALRKSILELLPGAQVEVPSIGGGVRNVDRLRIGQTDLAFSFANVAYSAYVGELPDHAKPFDDLRGIAILDLAPLHLLVRDDSAIRSVSDLRGRRVNAGGPGSGAALAVRLLTAAYGFEPTDMEPEARGYDVGLVRLLEGQIDAIFILGNYPSSPVTRAMERGARLLSISGPEVDRLRAAYPFFMPALIPKEGYPGLNEAVRTIGVESLLLCRADLDEDLVYAVTEAMAHAQDHARAVARSQYRDDMRRAAATPIPLHPGAVRYYRERELSH